MANQILAAKMIPHLGVPGLAAAPPGKLPSHHDFLRLLWHHEHYQMKGFNGIPSICCTIDSKTKKARCREVGDLMVPWSECRKGCREAGSPCLLAKVKHNWDLQDEWNPGAMPLRRASAPHDLISREGIIGDDWHEVY